MTMGKVTKKTASVARPGLGTDRILVYGLAFTLFALPLFILPNATEYGYTKTILAIVLTSILGILWGIDAWRKGTWAVRIPWITWPFLAFVAASLFSLLGATNGRFVVQSLVLLVVFFFLLVLISSAAREKRDVTLLLGSFLVSVSLVSLYGLLQYAGVLAGPGAGKGLAEVISTLGNKEYIAGLLAYILLPAVILIFRLRSTLVRLAALALIAFNFGALMLFDQAGANVALIAAFLAVVIGWLIFRPVEPLRRARAWILALILVVGLAYLVEAPSGPLNSVVGLSADGTSWIGTVWRQNSGATRTWDWWIGLEMWKESPWVGVGLGNYKLEFLPYKAQFLQTPRGANYDFYIPRAAQAHNEYVQVLAEVGVFGLAAVAAFLIFLASSLLSRLRRNADEGDRLDLILCSAGLVAVVVHALVSFPAHLPTSSLAAILFCGLALSPAYGDRATASFRVRGWKLRAAVVVMAVAGTAISVVAVRDLASNALMKEGIEQLQLGQTEAGKATLERSLRLDFAPHMTYFYLGMADARLGNLEAALRSLERCQTRFLEENTYLIYAELAANAGKTAVAREAIATLLATRPAPDIEQRARYVRAIVSLRDGDAQAASVELENLVRDAPDFEAARIALANVLLARGLRDAAASEYTRALAIVEGKLAAAEKTIGSATRMAASAYGELRSTIATLRSERDSILERLKP
ncbi:MAG: Wzy polymerase domain-containing protein, partial [Candidatus Bipolaricaulota bacterium]|nr:Wzy polymerase domain-containing protein [Candidatus Bipolaricaulota bacterium]